MPVILNIPLEELLERIKEYYTATELVDILGLDIGTFLEFYSDSILEKVDMFTDVLTEMDYVSDGEDNEG